MCSYEYFCKYIFKVNDKNTRKRHEAQSKSAMKNSKLHQLNNISCV